VIGDNLRRFLLVVGACVGETMQFNITAVFELHYATQYLHITPSLYLGALTLANLVSVVLIPIFGGISDRTGRRLSCRRRRPHHRLRLAPPRNLGPAALRPTGPRKAPRRAQPQPFTAPAVSPLTRNRLTASENTSTGSITITPPAAIRPHSQPT
jgi:hypothetical protein